VAEETTAKKSGSSRTHTNEANGHNNITQMTLDSIIKQITTHHPTPIAEMNLRN
jgi:hypothetical protein